jgi:hypothetical protein
MIKKVTKGVTENIIPISTRGVGPADPERLDFGPPKKRQFRKPKTSDYGELLRDPRWQKKRLKILERDNFTCRDTGATDEELQVHHCWYAKGPPWETPDAVLLTLSKSAHQRRQHAENEIKELMGSICAILPVDEVELFANNLTGYFYETNSVIRGERKPLIKPAAPVLLSVVEIDKAVKFNGVIFRQVNIDNMRANHAEPNP